LEGLPDRLHIDIVDPLLVILRAQGNALSRKQEYDVSTKRVAGTIGSGYSGNTTTTTHRLRINVPQDFHSPCNEDNKNLSRQPPGEGYSIVKEGNAPFG
jgi:hypothetical protein